MLLCFIDSPDKLVLRKYFGVKFSST